MASMAFHSARQETESGNEFAVKNDVVVAAQVSGTFVATITWQGTVNGDDWVSLRALNVSTGVIATTATAEGAYLIFVTGVIKVRANITAYTSGIIKVVGNPTRFAEVAPTGGGSGGAIVLAAGEAYVGQFGSSLAEVTITPTLETSSIDDGDVLFQPTEIAGAARVAAGITTLTAIKAVCVDDHGYELTLHFFKSEVTFGALDGAPSIDDTDVLEYLGHVVIPDFKWVDLGGSKVATLDYGDVGLQMQADTGETSIWVACTIADPATGTPTFTASGLQLTTSWLR